jgi:ligand-binding sensor domain-containing protein/signal transduction histidine kinase
LCRYDGVEFVRWGVEAGLQHCDVYALCFDSGGRLWIGTRGSGLFCYDRGLFTHYTSQQGLAHDVIHCLYEDRRQRMWVGTTEGVSCWDGDSFVTYSIVDGLPNDSVRSVCEDRDGTLWFGTAGGGAASLEEGRFILHTTSDGLPGSDVWSIYCDRRGRLWFGSDSGGVAYLEDGKFTNYTQEDGMASNRVRVIRQDSMGRMWFACWDGGVNVFDGRRFVRFGPRDGLHDVKVRSIHEDVNGSIWFAHPHSGLSQFEERGMHVLTDEPASENLIRDSKGAVWFTSDEGLCRLDRGELVNQNFGSRVYHCLDTAKHGFWVTTRWGGAMRYDDSSSVFTGTARRFTIKDGLGSDVTMGLLETRDGSLYAGTAYPGTLCRYDGERFSALLLPHPCVFRLYEDSGGRIWCGGFEGGGLTCFDGKSLTTYTTSDGLPSDRVQSILEDAEGRLWVGTQQGLSFFDGTSFYSCEELFGIDRLFHQASYRDKNGLLWFGTLMGGVYVSDGTRFQRMTKEDGLPSNSVVGLAELQGGGMVLGTYHGVVSYVPRPAAAPHIAIREVVADEVYAAPEMVELTQTQAGLITIAFRAISLSTRRMRYSYKLENYDDVWHHTSSETARYKDLPVGTYTFRVTSYDRNLTRSSDEAAVRIVVGPGAWVKQRAEYEERLGRLSEELATREKAERQNAVLVELAMDKSLDRGNLAVALRGITEAAAVTLDVTRVSVWLLEEDGNTFTCRDSYDRVSRRHNSWRALNADEFPTFYARMEQQRVLAWEETSRDMVDYPAMRRYLEEHNIQAGMTAPLRLARRIVGAVHFLHAGAPRAWELTERQFASSLADFVSLVLEENELRQAEAERRTMEAQVHRAEKLESLAVLAGGIAHDFNNLLMAIIGNADLSLATLPEDAKERHNLEQIQESGMHAADLTRKMLAFAGRSDAPLQHMNLNDLLESMRAALQGLARPPAKLHLLLDQELPPVKGECSQLRQLITSLVANAAEAVEGLPGGEVQVRTGTMEADEGYFASTHQARRLQPGDYVYLEVADTGIGMDAATQSRLFEPFFSTKFFGRGLGLAAVWGIVQGHQGAIRVESAPDGGSRFRVLFPTA